MPVATVSVTPGAPVDPSEAPADPSDAPSDLSHPLATPDPSRWTESYRRWREREDRRLAPYRQIVADTLAEAKRDHPELDRVLDPREPQFAIQAREDHAGDPAFYVTVALRPDLPDEDIFDWKSRQPVAWAIFEALIEACPERFPFVGFDTRPGESVPVER